MTDLPTGTVTFLFTDIEGSTSLAQQYPAELPALLARHHAILHQAIQAHNGHVFQIIGDAFCAAFHTAGDALNAALDAQRGLQHEPWHPAPIKVRMGLHTGAAQAGVTEERAGGYVGYSALARTQRVMSVAYGEQVLLSNPTVELVRGELPTDVTLRDMSEHRLKGLLNPEHLWQLVAPDVRQDFPPLQSLNAIPNNLPVQLTSFIGRENETAEVKQELAEHRLVTLTGSGGTGKTRLSLQVAADLLDHFEHGVWFVELAPLVDPDLIPQSIFSVMGLSEQPGKVPLEVLKEYLHDKKTLLVLDTCEHLIEASAKVTHALLNAAPHLTVLASSREALGVKGEVSYHVPSLSLPDPKHLPVIEQLSQYEAVCLFIDRTLLVAPHFDVTKENAPFIAQICYRLDGIPLAIELAAARVKMMSVEQISRRLDDRFRLLTDGARTALPRQKTLRALIDWSYDLLAENERRLLRWLSVFAGGWTLEAAEEVGSGDGIEPGEVLDLLTQLVNKSLVVVMEPSHGSDTRYRLLETVRQYASDRLLETGTSEAMRDRHLDYFLALAETAAPRLWTAASSEWALRLEADQDNYRLALEWSLNGSSRTEKSLRLANALKSLWHLRSEANEALHWLGTVTGLPKARLYSQAYSRAILNLGEINLIYVGSDKGEQILSQAVSLARALPHDDTQLLAEALDFLGLSLGFQKKFDQARVCLEESQALFRAAHSQAGSALAYWHLGWVVNDEGHSEFAFELYQKALALFQEVGDILRQSVLLGVIGKQLLIKGDLEKGKALLRQGLTAAHSIKSKLEVAHHLASLAYAEEIGGHLNRAIPLNAAVAKILHSIGMQKDYANLKEQLERLRQEIEPAVFETLTATGRAMTLEQAIEYALSEGEVT